jgi:hypothetical protein
LDETMARLSSREREKISPVWDLSQERVFAITVINQRVSFFLAFFSIVIGGSLNAKIQLHMQIILIVGAIVLWLLWLPIHYTQIRVNRILLLILEDEWHPCSIIVSQLPRRQRNVSALLTYSLTGFCCATLTIGAIFSLLGLLRPASL